MGTQYHLTVTVNLSNGTEINDIEVDEPVTVENIGDAAWEAASAELRRHERPDTSVTSLVIIAVVA